MAPRMYEKLKAGLSRLAKETAKLPPIVVRPHPKRRQHYEIIDGYHRRKALKELGAKKIQVFVLDVAEESARILTNTLNYVHGQADQEKYAEGVAELLAQGVSRKTLEELLPETPEDLDVLIESASLSVKAWEKLKDDYENEQDEDAKDREKTDADVFVELKFRVSAAQAQVIEAEIRRIGLVLTGKNKRGRALEFMAAMSGTTTIPEEAQA